MTRACLFLCIMILFLISSCKKDPQVTGAVVVDPVSGTSQVSFNFQPKVYSRNVIIGPEKYANASNDSFSVVVLNYYISNVVLTREDGKTYAEPESYHLLQHAENKTSFTFDLPAGNYTKIDFLIGVDSTRNVSGAQVGALDPIHGMFWTWDQGYRFFVMEGDFNTESQPVTGGYAIHVGGFKAPYSCIQKCSFTLATPLTAKSEGKSTVFYAMQLDEIFVHPKRIDFDYYYSHVTEQTFKDISDNYRDMFVIEKIDN